MDEKVFAELLGNHIRESGYTNYEFAKIVGINRVNVQRYLSGTRVPNRQVFEKIVEKLHIGIKEQELLFDSYQCAYEGKDAYYLKKTIRDILENADSLCGEETYQVEFAEWNQEKEIEAVHGKAAVEKLIWSILWKEIQTGEKREVFCFIPADKQILGRSFPTMKKEGISYLSNVKIIHLVALAKRTDLFRYHYYNLKTIQNLIPTYFQTGKSYETLYFYHDYPQIEFNDGLLYPYYVAAEKQIILLDTELNHALVVANRDFVSMYHDKIKTKILGGVYEDWQNILMKLNFFNTECSRK